MNLPLNYPLIIGFAQGRSVLAFSKKMQLRDVDMSSAKCDKLGGHSFQTIHAYWKYTRTSTAETLRIVP